MAKRSKRLGRWALILGGIAFVAGAFVTHWPGAAN